MVDSFNMELITWTDIQNQYPFWNQWCIVKELIAKRKEPQILHTILVIDTSQVTAPSEDTTDPAKNIIDFTTAAQAYLQSDDGTDGGLKFDVIGQKGDGSFGQFTLEATEEVAGYQEFTATTVTPAAATYTFKCSIDGAALDGGADIDVALR